MDLSLFKVTFKDYIRRFDEHASPADREEREGLGGEPLVVAENAEKAIDAVRQDQVGTKVEYDLENKEGWMAVDATTRVVAMDVERIRGIDLFAP